MKFCFIIFMSITTMAFAGINCPETISDPGFCTNDSSLKKPYKISVNGGSAGLIHDVGYSTSGKSIVAITLSQAMVYSGDGILLNSFRLPNIPNSQFKDLSIVAWAFSKDERNILLISNQGLAAIFDVFTGKLLSLDLLEKNYIVTAARFADDVSPRLKIKQNTADYTSRFFVTTGILINKEKNSDNKTIIGTHLISRQNNKGYESNYINTSEKEAYTEIWYLNGSFVLTNQESTTLLRNINGIAEVVDRKDQGNTTRNIPLGNLLEFAGFSNTVQNFAIHDTAFPVYAIRGSSMEEPREGIQLIRLESKNKKSEVSIPWPDVHTAIAIAPDKKTFVAGTRSGMIRIGELPSGKRKNVSDASYVGVGIEFGAASPSGRYVAFTTGLAKGYLVNAKFPVIIFDEKSGEIFSEFIPFLSESGSFIDDKYFVVYGHDPDKESVIFDLENRTIVQSNNEKHSRLIKLARAARDTNTAVQHVEGLRIKSGVEEKKDLRNVRSIQLIGYQKTNAKYRGAAGFHDYTLDFAPRTNDKGESVFDLGIGAFGVVSVTNLGLDGNQIKGTASLATLKDSNKEGWHERLIKNGIPARYSMTGQSGNIETPQSSFEFNIQGSNVIDIKFSSESDKGKLYAFHDAIIFVDSSGYFYGKGNYLNYVYAIFENRSQYSIQQFYDIFYRPDIVQAKLRGENIRPLIGDLTIEKALQNPPPRVELAQLTGQSAARRVKVPYTITPEKGGVAEVRIFQNGKLISSDGTYKDAPGKTYAPVAGKSADAGRYAEANLQRNAKLAEDSKGNTNALRDRLIVRGAPEKHCNPCKGEVEVEVIPGEENNITVVAFNRDNTIQSIPASVSFKSTLPKEEPHLWVMGVGIDQFAGISALKNAHKDAQDFICTYAGKEQVSKLGVACTEDGKAKTLFKAQNIHVVDALFDSQATKSNILAALDKVARQAKPGDTFVWFVASHGMMDANSNFGIIAHDTQCLNDNCTDIKGHITSNEILEASKKIKAMKQLVVLDTCHSGGLDSKLSGLYDARVSLLAKNMGLHLYASAQVTEAAQDGAPGTNGTFTAQLLAGIKGAAQHNSSGQISVVTLGEYARQKTIEATQKTDSKGQSATQTPVIQHFGQDTGLTRMQ